MKVTEVLKALRLPNAAYVYMQGFEKAEREGKFSHYKIDTPLRISYFLAMVMTETGGLQYVRENMNYSAKRILQVFGQNKHSAAVTPKEATALAHNPEALAERVYGLGNPKKAAELGNTRPGDGWSMRGAGPMQITGGKGFRAASRRLGVDFYADPDLIVSSQYILLASLDYWLRNNLWQLADKNDINTLTKRLNGGYNGLQERRRWFEKIYRITSGIAQPDWQVTPVRDETRKLQRDLNTLGADPKLREDGRFGPATEVAVRKFQQDNGLTVDGIPGQITQATIKLRLSTTARSTKPTAQEQEAKAPKDHTASGGILVSIGLAGEEILNRASAIRDLLPDTERVQQIMTVIILVGVLLVFLSIIAKKQHKKMQLLPRLTKKE